MKKYAIYLRVSTRKQGAGGLGMAAQRAMCEDFIKHSGGVCAAEFSDVESGTHRDRKGLAAAIEYCKRNACALVIAKLDRLARDVEFCFKVVNTGIEIHFCDMPTINTLLLGVFASVAQYERELCSQRTTAALSALKAKGEKLGASNEKYVAAIKAKSEAEKMDIIARRAKTQNERKKNSRDTQAFIKVLRNVFPDVCKNDDPTTWRGWWRINTHKENRTKILQLMRDYNDVDSSLFSGWEFSGDDRKLQIKLAGYIRGLKNSFNYEQACKIAS